MKYLIFEPLGDDYRVYFAHKSDDNRVGILAQGDDLKYSFIPKAGDVQFMLPDYVLRDLLEKLEELNNPSPYYELFKFFSEQHGLTLLNEEIQEVIHEVKNYIKSNGEESN